MDILMFENFNKLASNTDFDNTYPDLYSGTSAINIGGGRYEGNSASLSDLNWDYDSPSHLLIGGDVFPTGSASDSLMVGNYSRTTSFVDSYTNWKVMYKQDGSIWVEGSNGVLLGNTAPGVLTMGAWQYVEILGSHSNSGSIEVYVDGSIVVNVDGDTYDEAKTVLMVSFDDAIVDNFIIAGSTASTLTDLPLSGSMAIVDRAAITNVSSEWSGDGTDIHVSGVTTPDLDVADLDFKVDFGDALTDATHISVNIEVQGTSTGTGVVSSCDMELWVLYDGQSSYLGNIGYTTPVGGISIPIFTGNPFTGRPWTPVELNNMVFRLRYVR